MHLQKFVGENTPAVLEDVRAAMGSNAIILANRRVGDKIEIIATTELDDSGFDNAELYQQSGRSDSSTAVAASATAPGVELRHTEDALQAAQAQLQQQNLSEHKPSEQNPGEQNPGIAANLQKLDELAEQLNTASHPQSIDQQAECDSRPQPELEAGTVRSAAKPEVEPAVQPEPSVAATDKAVSADSPILQAGGNIEIQLAEGSVDVESGSEAVQGSAGRIVRKLISNTAAERFNQAMLDSNNSLDQRLHRLEVNLWGASNPVQSQLLQQFLKMGLGAEYSIRLIEQLEDCQSADMALRQALSLLVKSLPVAADDSLTARGVCVVSGPPGSGKTTSLVKLATEKVLKSGKQSVVLVCADAKRIGAFESLQAYGRLLGVPVVHAHSSEALENIVHAFSEKELVLIDHTLPGTPGAVCIPEQGFDDDDQSKLRHLLVLPAHIQAAAAEQIVSAYPGAAAARCVITHLDQPCRLGELFTTVSRHQMNIAYWSDCSQVQLPLQKASASVLVATAMAMSSKLETTSDEKFLLDMIQPSPQLCAGSGSEAIRWVK